MSWRKSFSFLLAVSLMLAASQAQAEDVTVSYTITGSVDTSGRDFVSGGVEADLPTANTIATTQGYGVGGWISGTWRMQPGFAQARGIVAPATADLAYVYTIFDSAGENNPTATVNNLNNGTIGIVSGGGTGIFDATAVPIVRDGDGNWFVANLADAKHVTHTDTTVVWNVSTDITGWQSVDATNQANMNAMASPPVSSALTLTAGATPNWASGIKGAGIFVVTDPGSTVTGNVYAKWAGIVLTEPTAAGTVSVVDGTTPVAPAGTVDFGSTAVGGSALTKTLTVTNESGAALDITGVNVPTGYTVTQALPAQLATGASADLIISLDTDNVGTFSGDVTIDLTTLADFVFSVTGTISPPASVREWRQF